MRSNNNNNNNIPLLRTHSLLTDTYISCPYTHPYQHKQTLTLNTLDLTPPFLPSLSFPPLPSPPLPLPLGEHAGTPSPATSGVALDSALCRGPPNSTGSISTTHPVHIPCQYTLYLYIISIHPALCRRAPNCTGDMTHLTVYPGNTPWQHAHLIYPVDTPSQHATLSTPSLTHFPTLLPSVTTGD